jgi:uncharacterized protein (DUF927 family)
MPSGKKSRSQRRKQKQLDPRRRAYRVVEKYLSDLDGRHGTRILNVADITAVDETNFYKELFGDEVASAHSFYREAFGTTNTYDFCQIQQHARIMHQQNFSYDAIKHVFEIVYMGVPSRFLLPPYCQTHALFDCNCLNINDEE